MKRYYDHTKTLSSYHHNPDIVDRLEDVIISHGNFPLTSMELSLLFKYYNPTALASGNLKGQTSKNVTPDDREGWFENTPIDIIQTHYTNCRHLTTIRIKTLGIPHGTANFSYTPRYLCAITDKNSYQDNG